MYLLYNSTFHTVLQNPNFIGRFVEQTRRDRTYTSHSQHRVITALCDIIVGLQKSFPSAAVVFTPSKTIKKLLLPGAEGS